MPKARLYYIPRRGQIVTPLGVTTVAPPVLTPRFGHTSVRAIFTAHPKVFSPPFSSATMWTPTVVRAVGRSAGIRLAHSRTYNYIPTILPPPGPAPLVPEFRRTRVISLRGLKTPQRTDVFPFPPVFPPPPLPGKPQSSGGIVKDFLHWWRTGAN